MVAQSEIKVSVNGTDDKNNNIANKPTPTKKKITNKAVKNMSKSTLVKKKTPILPPKKSANSNGSKTGKAKGGLGRLLGTAVLTTLIVGGGIYIWQESAKDKVVDKLSGEAQEAKLSFEDRIEKLKIKLTGTEKQKLELEAKTKELEERMAILNKAKIDFKSEEFGFGFTYPAVFGELAAEESVIGSTTRLMGKWEENEKLIFGGVSEDYALADTTTIPEVGELMGFTERRRDYFLLGPANAEYEVNPVEVIETRSGDAILLDARSFILEEDEAEVPVNIGQNAVIVVNLDSEDYSGLAFMNSDFGMLPLESFIQMIETFEIIK